MGVRHIQSILLVDDERYETELLVRHLADDFEVHAAIDDDALAHSLFDHHPDHSGQTAA